MNESALSDYVYEGKALSRGRVFIAGNREDQWYPVTRAQYMAVQRFLKFAKRNWNPVLDRGKADYTLKTDTAEIIYKGELGAFYYRGASGAVRRISFLPAHKPLATE